ncbi:glycosyltransferase family 4 protein [Leptolyngbya sp. 7M]|uniref:glycosyltransferase family 4 protein n=1 Tax=Leptolyngbya sp. 7M TaxID=2812896 RepID=UPI001B8CD279|nr:glycosyltransferase family 4 protein [Leptolyngbya sp. 7M]QYO62863.1 glycosyltransferase family 4 protein [Leptolyngbya sp. 7M]
MNTFANRKFVRVLMLGAGLDVQGGITSVEKLMLDYAPPELKIRHVPTFAKGSATRNIAVFLGAIATLIQALSRNQTDLVHIHFSDRGSTFRKLILAFIILCFRKPFVLHCHGAAYREFYTQLPRVVKELIIAGFSQCAKFIALSESWRDFYSKSFHLSPDQMVVLPNPVVLPAEVPDRSQQQTITFVFLGRIGEHGGALDVVRSVIAFPRQDKGAFDLIRAFAALPESVRAQARLVLAGNGNVEQAQTLIADLGLADRAVVHAWVNPTQRDQLLANASVFVLPSYNEGLPMSMLEAMAWELPVIVTPVGGIPEVITSGRNGLLVQPGNLMELTEAMKRLIQDHQLRNELGIAAQNTVRALDVKHYMQSILKLYVSILE